MNDRKGGGRLITRQAQERTTISVEAMPAEQMFSTEPKTRQNLIKTLLKLY